MEEVEKHFRQAHLPNIIKQIESVTLTGTATRNIRDRELARLARNGWEEQNRFPLQLATTLSQQFASRGLQFFKVNKTLTHVAVARPHFLDIEATPVSDGVKRIVDLINATTKCTHKQLLVALAPAPKASAAPAADTAPAAEGEAAVPASPAATEPSPELAAVMTDLHWLIHQGHVIEFANGVLETAKRPLPKPVKQSKAPKAAAQPAAAVATPEGGTEVGEVTGGEAPIAVAAEEAPAAPVAEATEPVTAAEPAPASSETPSAN